MLIASVSDYRDVDYMSQAHCKLTVQFVDSCIALVTCVTPTCIFV